MSLSDRERAEGFRKYVCNSSGASERCNSTSTKNSRENAAKAGDFHERISVSGRRSQTSGTPTVHVFPEEIDTERLRLRRLSRENVPTLRLYDHMRAGAPGMEEVSDYVLWDPHESPRDTYEYLVTVEKQWDEREQATYAIHPDEFEEAEGENGERDEPISHEHSTETPEIAGTTNLHFDWDRQSAELGIWLRKAFWGRGYSGERAAALLELAFDRLDLEVVGASHRDGNDRSRRAIEKYVEAFGGQYDGLLRNFVPTDDGVRDLHRFTVTREQYREAVEDASDEERIPSSSDSS